VNTKLVEFLESIPERLRSKYVQIKDKEGKTLLDLKDKFGLLFDCSKASLVPLIENYSISILKRENPLLQIKCTRDYEDNEFIFCIKGQKVFTCKIYEKIPSFLFNEK